MTEREEEEKKMRQTKSSVQTDRKMNDLFSEEEGKRNFFRPQTSQIITNSEYIFKLDPSFFLYHKIDILDRIYYVDRIIGNSAFSLLILIQISKPVSISSIDKNLLQLIRWTREREWKKTVFFLKVLRLSSDDHIITADWSTFFFFSRTIIKMM